VAAAGRSARLISLFFRLKTCIRSSGSKPCWHGVIFLPLRGAMSGTRPVGALDAAVVTLWPVGFAFEAGADWQVARFKAHPTDAGKLMDRGFWRFTRHPNYFGDFCI
jgi:steroid 5-alpha reductase family enzyme